MMIRTFRCSLLTVLYFVGFIGPHNVSGIVLSKATDNLLKSEEQHDGFSCTLPPFPENGGWIIINGKGQPGEKIQEDKFIKFECQPGYDLTSKYPYVFCDTNWNHDIMPKCMRSTINYNISGIYSSKTWRDIKRLKRQNDGFKCTLPPYPENGKWTIVNGDGRPGDEVDIDTGLKFRCHPRYTLTPKYPYLICDTNWSLDSIPKCLKLCSPLYSTPTTSLKCKDATGNAISCSEATEGTYLTYQCIPFYEALGRKQSLYCSGGKWDFPTPVCQPVCGRKVNHEVRPLVIGGEDTNKFEYPWITAIYIKNKGKFVNNCGGTLLNPRIILTAAHCVANTYGDAIPADNVEIGAGKYFNEYGDTRDIYAQYSQVARLIVHEEFKGDTRRFQYDIALIVTKRLLTLGPVVQPVCYSNINTIYPHVGSVGELAGWGITEDGKPSDSLRTIRIPYKEKITCTQELPHEWSDRYNFDDKMCAGFHKQNKSVCPGDSGSGLVFRNPEDNRFYVHGVVSISPKIVNGFCNNQDNSLFTKVAHYYEWLDKKSTTNYIEDCILPPFPKNGKWDIEVGTERLPGDIVSSTSIIIYSCRKGYKLSTVNSKFFCEPSLVPPTCECIRFRILPVILKNGNKEVATYAFLDEGSSVTMLEEGLSEELKLQGDYEPLCLKWTGEQQRLETRSQKVIFSIIGDFKGAKQFDYCPARTVNSLNLPQQTVDASKLATEYSYLRNLPIKSYENANPRILIGLDNWKVALSLRVVEGDDGQPIAAKSRLGWTVFALRSVPSRTLEPTYNYHACECVDTMMNNQELHEAVKTYFSLESLGVRASNVSSKELRRAEHIMQSTISHDGNRYSIGLLWKYDDLKLPDSRHMALNRLTCIERRIERNPDLGVKINCQIEDLIKKGYIRKLTPEELSQKFERVWYLPIFPVLNPNKPGKFRIVWDAAAKVEGISLNSMLLKGDDQLASLLGVLLRFRERRIGFSADIKEMFLRVGIRSEDQQAQRFYWRNGNPQNTLETYVMSVMTFGATCSPSCAQYVKNANARQFSSLYPRAVECIIKNHYVDDLLDTADNEQEAIQIAKQVALIHSKANFEIRHWRSNSKKLMEIMNDSTDYPKEMNIDMGTEENTEKILGMWWNLTTDCLIYSLKYNKGNKEVLEGKRKPTKREILRILMSIYDPLGLLAHFLVYLKILLQDIWRSRVSWDEPISNEQFDKWLLWLKFLPDLEKLSIPRCYLGNFPNENGSTIQLHMFVDASVNASAVAAYLRISREDGAVECVLIGAKTHVAPIKLQTIPRLELDGALLGARFAKNVRQHMSITIHDTIYWSDSKIVLSWIRSDDPRKLRKYAAYRIAEIQDNSMISNWRYVPTNLNVADEATKWSKQPSLKSTDRWFKGPEFLYEEEKLWPTEESDEDYAKESLNVHINKGQPIIQMDKFSRYTKLLRIMGYVYKFITTLKGIKYKQRSMGVLTSEELKHAENSLIRMVQKEFFPEEIKALTGKSSTVSRTSSIYKLSPYSDIDGILRVRGRIDGADCIDINAKRPIILPRESHLTKLIIENYHFALIHYSVKLGKDPLEYPEDLKDQ